MSGTVRLMKINDALAGATLLGLDTDVVITSSRPGPRLLRKCK